MDFAPWPGSPGLHVWVRLEAAGDEAVLPAGTCLADDGVPGRQCFALLEGSALIETGGRVVRELQPGSFVGQIDQEGRPAPLVGVTVRLASSSRVLVFDVMRLATLIEADSDAAAAWRELTGNTGEVTRLQTRPPRRYWFDDRSLPARGAQRQRSARGIGRQRDLLGERRQT